MNSYKIFSLYYIICSLSVLLAQFPIKQVHSLSPAVGSQYGKDVSVFEDRIAVSSPKKYHSGMLAGSVEIYTLQNADWVFDTQIVADAAAPFSQFGHSIALGDSILIVGAPHYGNLEGKGIRSGAVYIFELTSSGWNQTQRLIPNDLSANYNFGFSVDIHQNYIAIGAFNGSGDNMTNSGAVYMYKKENDTWVPDAQQKIYPIDGKYGDRFGFSLSLINQSDYLYLLVGAYQSDNKKGAAYLFAKNISSNLLSKEKPAQITKSNMLKRTSTADIVNKVEVKKLHRVSQYSNDWEQLHKFQPNDLENGDHFGYSVSIDEDNLIIGSPMAYGNTMQSGAAYHFEKDVTGNWLQKNKLFNDNSDRHDKYGIHVGISSSNIFIGSTHHDYGFDKNPGKIFSYRYLNNELNEKNQFLSLNSKSYNYYGSVFDMHDQLLIAGSQHEDGNTLHRGEDSGSGAAYTYWPNLEIKPWGIAIDTIAYGTTAFDTLVVHNYSNSIIGLSVNTDDINFITFDEDNFQIDANGYITIPMVLNGSIAGNGPYTTNINFTWDDNSVPNYSYVYEIEISSDMSISDGLLPTDYALDNIFPNPFNPTTTIQYSIPNYSKVNIRIFDIRGRLITELVSQNMNPGYFSVVWNASPYSSGIYFAQMIAGNYINTKKIMLIK